MAQRHERTLARQMAAQALYMSSVSGMPVSDFIAAGAELPDQGHLPPYAMQLLEGADAQREEIDAKLAEVSQNWSVERMPAVDHAILLMAVYEMLNVEQVPVSVCINEAVELAKSFGGEDDSARFANGVLGRIARTYAAARIAGDDSLPQDLQILEEDAALSEDAAQAAQDSTQTVEA